MSNELKVVENLELVPFFTKGEKVDDVLLAIEKEALSFVAGDMSIKKDRDAVKAMVTKVTKSKTYLEKSGKELAAEYKEIPKKIDENRRKMNDFLNNLQAKVRAPLTEWEIEDKRIKEEEAARIEAEKIKAEIDAAHEIALLMDDKFNRDLADKLAAEEVARIEALRIEEEQRIKREEEIRQQAIIEAETKAKIEAERVEREKQEAVLRAEQAERERIAAIERAKIEAEQAELRRIEAEKAAKLHAEQMAEQARLNEIKRHQEEARRIQEEINAREADKNHRRKINSAALDALVKAGLTEDMAKAVITAICKNEVPNVKINY